MNRTLAIMPLLAVLAASAQTTTKVSTTLSTGQTVTVPVTVTLGTPVVSGNATITTPPPANGGTVASANCSAMALGKDANPNGFIPATIAEFYKDISAAPVNATLTAGFQDQYCTGGCDRFHLDNTMPYSVVTNPAMVSVTFTDSADSDNVQYPVSASTPTEGNIIGASVSGKTVSSNGDHHAIVINRDSCTDYEIYQLQTKSGKWLGYAGEAWSMSKPDTRAPGRNSADVAGLPIYPLLINYDEANSGTINHAFRFTCGETNTQFMFPATHSSGGGGSCYPGMRIRLRASFDVSKYPARIQAIMNALKKYGAYVADSGGNFYFTATDDSRWNTDETNLLGDLNEGVFDVVNEGYSLQNLPQ